MTASGRLSAQEKAALPLLRQLHSFLAGGSEGSLFRRGLSIPKYKVGDLYKQETNQQPRTELFLQRLQELAQEFGGPVPYAFRLPNGETRFLDAGCLGFLYHRRPPAIDLIYDRDEFITHVAPVGTANGPKRTARTAVRAPRPIANTNIRRIYASLEYSFEPDVWGSFSFANEGTRDRLSRVLGDEVRVLVIGTMGEETSRGDRGNLLALLELGAQSVPTDALVEPTHWRKHLIENDGVPRWPYGLPILSAEAFRAPLASSREILPRFFNENIHMKLATNFVEPTPDEVDRVLALPRTPVPYIWTSPAGSFAANLRKASPGPPPSPGQRMLVATSGPAATYCLELDGPAKLHAARDVLGRNDGLSVFKVGFSNDPVRRAREINAYLPEEPNLRWKTHLVQWHNDEINAYAMEQEVFHQLAILGADRFKGEMVTATHDQVESAWSSARSLAKRPETPVSVDVYAR